MNRDDREIARDVGGEGSYHGGWHEFVHLSGDSTRLPSGPAVLLAAIHRRRRVYDGIHR